MSAATPDATVLWLSVDAWEWVDIILGIGLVFVGVALEGVAELQRYRRFRILGFRIGRVGLLLVVLGLAVEIVCAPIVWYLNHLEIASLWARAAEADTEMVGLEREVADANARAAEAMLKTERARADARRAQQLALPRTLTNQLALEDKIALEPFAGTLLVIVSSRTADEETWEFAWSLSIVDVAGWKCKSVKRDHAMPGFRLWTAHNAHEAAQAFAALVKRETGVEATNWPLEPGVAQAAFPELAAEGIDVMTPNLIIAEVGKRSFSDEIMKDRWRRHVEERGGPSIDE